MATSMTAILNIFKPPKLPYFWADFEKSYKDFEKSWHVGQICRALQKRFGEHYHRMKKPKSIDTFLYQHFKRTGHSPNDVLVQPVEKLTYDKNSSSRFKIIKRHKN